MTLKTVWHDNGTVKCVDSADSTATIQGAEKATADTNLVGDITLDHVVTVVDGVVTETVYSPPLTPIEVLRARKAEEIKQHGLSLIQSRIPAIDSYEMVSFMRVLWPTLTDPDTQPDLAYARDVYLYAVGKLDKLETATREQIEGYDPATDPNWP